MGWEVALFTTGFLWLASLVWGVYRFLHDAQKVPLRLQSLETEVAESSPPPANNELDEAWERQVLAAAPTLFPTIERWLSGRRLMSWLTKELQRAHVAWDASSVIAFIVLGMAFVLTLTIIVATMLAPTSSPLWRLVVAVAVACLVPLAVLFWLRRQQRNYMRRVELVLPDTLGLIANSLRAGMGLQQALEIASREGLPPLREEFAIVTRSLALGTSLEEALQAMMDRVASPELQLALVAALVQREVGGSLAPIFETAGATVRRRLQLRRELQAETALTRFSAFFLAFGLPSFLFVALNLVTYLQTHEAWSAPMFMTAEGRLALLVLVGLELVGWFWLSQVLAQLSE